jgi:polyisoprenyl-teichoic acid--peptidoglycan teichoic acid transferase
VKKIVEQFPQQPQDGLSVDSSYNSLLQKRLQKKKNSTTQATNKEVSQSVAHRVRKSPSLSHKLVRWVFWGGAFCITATISAALGATVALLTPISPLLKSDAPTNLKEDLWQRGFRYSLARPVNILLTGVDWVPNAPANSPEVFSGHTDTMLLVRLDPQGKSASVLSIPRDTQVEIPNLGISKINQANVEGGATLTARVVSRTLNNVAVDRYVRVTNNAVRELVDMMGGIEVYVPYPMQYKDVTQNLAIDLKPGWQTLNGSQAEQFARFRGDGNGDIGRVQRQQTLLKAIRQRLLNPTVLPRLPQILGVMQQYVDTNLSLEETMALGGFMLDLQPEKLRMVLLPGRFSQPQEYKASYWLLNQQARDRLMQEYFQTDIPGGRPATSSTPEQRPALIRIAIQNATGSPKLAEKFARDLASKGFDNTYIVADWTESVAKTQIIVQQGDLEMGNRLQRVLGVGNLEPSSTGDINSDFTIRVGRDWLETQPQ